MSTESFFFFFELGQLFPSFYLVGLFLLLAKSYVGDLVSNQAYLVSLPTLFDSLADRFDFLICRRQLRHCSYKL